MKTSHTGGPRRPALALAAKPLPGDGKTPASTLSKQMPRDRPASSSRVVEAKRESPATGRPLALRAMMVFTPASPSPTTGPTLAQSEAELRADPTRLPHVPPSQFGPQLLQALVRGCRRHLSGWEDEEIALALMGPKPQAPRRTSPEAALVRRLTDPAGLPDESDHGHAFVLDRRAELLGLMYGRMRVLKDRLAEDHRLLNATDLPYPPADTRQALALRARAFDQLYKNLSGGLGMDLARNLAELEVQPGHEADAPQAFCARLLRAAARSALLKHLSEAQRLNLVTRLSDQPPNSRADRRTPPNLEALRGMRTALYETLSPAQRLEEAHRLCAWDSLPDDDRMHPQAIAGRAHAFRDLCGLLAPADRNQLLDSLCQQSTLPDGGLERATDCALRVSLLRAMSEGGLSMDRWTQAMREIGTPQGVPQDEPRRSQTLALWRLAGPRNSEFLCIRFLN